MDALRTMDDVDTLKAEVERLKSELARADDAQTRAEILYQSSSIGIWDWTDVHGESEFWSPRFYELLGYSPGEIPATLGNFRQLLHPDDHARTFALVDAHFEDGTPFDLVYRLKHKTKGYRWFHGLGKAVFDAEGQPIRMVGSIQDVHEEHVAHEKLEALTLRHQLSLNASNIGIWDWDVIANVLVWDEQMYRLYGTSEADFDHAYAAWESGVHPDDRDRGAREVQDALAGQREFNTEFRVCWPSGEIHTIRAIATVVRDPEGTPLRMVGVNWDITEEKQRSAELESKSVELAEVNEQLEQFVYFASHDLQAPIRHISAFIELLDKRLKPTLDEETSQWMGFVAEGAVRMRELVEDLLLFSRAARQEIHVESVPLDSLIDHTKSVFTELAVEHGSLPTVRGSRTLLGQVFQNLFENAVRYAREDVAPQVRLVSTEDDTHWHLQVIDNGVGVDAALCEQAFEPFRRLSRAGGGSGIGLALCRRVVERHGGTIDLRPNETGPGSTVAFSLAKQPVDS